MRFLKNLVFPFAFLFCFSGLAQIPKLLFDYPQQEYKTSVFEASVADYNTYGGSENNSGFQSRKKRLFPFFKGPEKKNSFKDLAFAHKFYLSKEHLQLESDLKAGFMQGSLNFNNNLGVMKVGEINGPSIHSQFRARRYIKDNSFYELGLLLNYCFTDFLSQYIHYDYYHDYYRGLNYSYSIFSRDHSFKGFVPLRLGIGRINQVQHLLHIKALTDQLLKTEDLEVDLIPADAIELTELMLILNKKRFASSQEKKLKEIQLLDSFLIAKNYKQTPAIFYPAIKGGNSLSRGVVRNQGRRFSLGFTGGWNFANVDSEMEVPSIARTPIPFYFKRQNWIFSVGADYKNEKSLGANWHNSFALYGNIVNYLASGEMSSQIFFPKRDVVWIHGVYEYPYLNQSFFVFQLGLNQQFTCYAHDNFDFSLGYTIKQSLSNIKSISYKYFSEPDNQSGRYLALDYKANFYISRALSFKVAGSLFNLSNKYGDSNYSISYLYPLFLNPNEPSSTLPAMAVLSHRGPGIRFLRGFFSNYLSASLAYRIL